MNGKEWMWKEQRKNNQVPNTTKVGIVILMRNMKKYGGWNEKMLKYMGE